MPLGPVFQAELVTTARRARYFVVRALYGLVLLLVLWSGYRALREVLAYRPDEELTIGEMTEFARGLFQTFAMAQFLTILVLTPALVAPVIAAEKSRKTLQYLLCSRLSSAEVVLGKLAARVLLLVVLLAVGLPVLSLLMLFGGIDREMIALTYAALGAEVIFLAGLSILVSTLATEPRRAIFHAYASLLFFPVAPLLIYLLVLFPFAGRRDEIMRFLMFFWPVPRPEEFFGYSRLGVIAADEIIRLTIAWAAYGLAFAAIATALLRPIGRREQARRRVELRIDNRGRWRWRVLPRPPCGDHAMIWKERHTSRSGGVVKLIGLFVNLFLTVLVGCLAFELARDAWRVLSVGGYGRTLPNDARDQFNAFIRFTTLCVSGLWMLGVTATSAASITAEREGDTWVSLLSTTLTGREILRAKMLGAVLRFRWLGLVLGALWAVGLACGSVHPLGLVFALLELPIFLGFAAALGVACSLDSRTTTRALALALGLLAFTNGGYMLFQLAAPVEKPEPYMGGVAPWLLGSALASYPDVASLSDPPLARAPNSYGYPYNAPPPRQTPLLEALPATAYGVPLYLLAACLLAWQAIRRFDAVEDRPPTEYDPVAEQPASERRRRWALR